MKSSRNWKSPVWLCVSVSLILLTLILYSGYVLLKQGFRGLDEFVPDGTLLPNEFHMNGITYRGVWGDMDTDCILLRGTCTNRSLSNLLSLYEQHMQTAGWSLKREGNSLIGWKSGNRYDQEVEIVQCSASAIVIGHVSLSKNSRFTISTTPRKEWRSRHFGKIMDDTIEEQADEKAG
jgi:hypothetical protein